MRARRNATEVRVRGCHTDAFQYHVCTPTCMQGVRHRPIVGPDLLTGPMFENTMVSRTIFSLFPWVRVTYTGDEALSFSLFPLSPLLPVSRNTLLLPLAVCLYAYFFLFPSSTPSPFSCHSLYILYLWEEGIIELRGKFDWKARMTRSSRGGRPTAAVREEKLKGLSIQGTRLINARVPILTRKRQK